MMKRTNFPRIHLIMLVLAWAALLCSVSIAEEPKTKLGETQVKRSGKVIVQVYLEENFKGKSYRIEVPAELPSSAKLKELGIPNDSIASMKIPDGVVVSLYDADAFKGTSQIFTGKVPSVGEMKGLTSSLKAELKTR